MPSKERRRKKSKSAPRSLNTVEYRKVRFLFLGGRFENFRPVVRLIPKGEIVKRVIIYLLVSSRCRSLHEYVLSYLCDRWSRSIVDWRSFSFLSPPSPLLFFSSSKKRTVRGNATAYNALTYPNNLRRCVHLGCTETRVIPRVPCHVPRSKHL